MNRLSAAEVESRVASCLREHVSEVVASRMGDKVYRDAFCGCGWELPWDLDKREEALTDHRAEVIAAVLGPDAHTEACGATYHGHACTLHVGHTSNHLSRDENANPVASWHDAHTEQKGTGR